MSRKDTADELLLAKLTEVLAAATEAAIAARVKLRNAVCDFVAVEHGKGMPLETVIQMVKDILKTAEKSGAKATDELAVQLIDWCVEFHRKTGLVPPVLIS